MSSINKLHMNADRLAALLLVLFAITLAASAAGWLLPVMAPGIADAQGFDGLTIQTKSLALIFTVFSYAVSLGCAVWLFMQATKEGRNPWVWLTLGLLGGGVLAVILWFAVQMQRTLSEIKQQNQERV